jgi:hypothetical protein
MGKQAKKVRFAGLAAGGGAVAGGALSGAGGVTVSSCPPEETGFYCTFVRGFDVFKMTLVILAVVLFIALLLWWMLARKAGR